MGTDTAIEQDIQQKGASSAPRVTLADVEANIAYTEIVKHVAPSGQILRWAVLTTRSGFAVTGDPSASVSPENDDQAIGESLAMRNARDQLWKHMGYALKERMEHGASDARAAAGAVYDFAGYLTTREQAITMGATHDAAPAADACRAFLEMRGLGGGTEPDVMGWSKLAAPADFRERVRAEKRELDERLGKLETFIDGERFQALPTEEQDRMRRQAAAMRDYSTVLHERIAAFQKA